jgi:hypothetical protein
MTTTYELHSNLGFIGFAFINSITASKQGYISLFDAVQIEDNIHLYPLGTLQSNFQLTDMDIDIIRRLMLQAIPTMRTTGMVYRAFDKDRIQHNI